MNAAPTNRVVIIQKFVAQYRVAFFDGLRARLAASGIELVLVHGQPAEAEALKADSAKVGWAGHVRNRTIAIGGKTLVWQPVLKHVRAGDLVIVEQASKLLVNYLLFVLHLTGRLRLALWGHGRDLVSPRPHRYGEAVKRWLSRRVHWWFAYTEGSARLVGNLGFPATRVTTVQNAIDTRELARAKAAISTTDKRRARERLGLRSENVAIYCGSLYRAKRLDFLFEAADALRARIPDFELLVLGAGPDREMVERAAAARSWIHNVGPAFGAEKALYFAISRAVLIPGLVGLAIVDSFVFETPLVAISGAGHAPEIEYLEDGRNGVLLPAGVTPEEYADAVARLFLDDKRGSALADGCRASANQYTVEHMVERFANGIERAIAANPLSHLPALAKLNPTL